MEVTVHEVRAIGWMMINTSQLNSCRNVLTVEPCVAIDLAKLTMYFDWRYSLYIQKLYHRPHLTLCGCCNKSLHLQPLQRCYCENSGSSASACVMGRHYSVASRNKWFTSCGTSVKLTLWVQYVLSSERANYDTVQLGSCLI